MSKLGLKLWSRAAESRLGLLLVSAQTTDQCLGARFWTAPASEHYYSSGGHIGYYRDCRMQCSMAGRGNVSTSVLPTAFSCSALDCKALESEQEYETQALATSLTDADDGIGSARRP